VLHKTSIHKQTNEINTPVKSVQEEISKILHTWKKVAREKVDKSAAELKKFESTANVHSDLLNNEVSALKVKLSESPVW
jgi:hypothetical protein